LDLSRSLRSDSYDQQGGSVVQKRGVRLFITQPLFLASSFGIASKTAKKLKDKALGFDFKPLRA